MKLAVAVAALIAAAFLFSGCETPKKEDAYPLTWQTDTNGQAYALKIENWGVDHYRQARITQTKPDGSSRVFELVVQREQPVYVRCDPGDRFKIERLGAVKSFAVPTGLAGAVKLDDPKDGVYEREPEK